MTFLGGVYRFKGLVLDVAAHSRRSVGMTAMNIRFELVCI